MSTKERQVTVSTVTLNLQNGADDDEHFIRFHADAKTGTVEIDFPNCEGAIIAAEIKLDMEDFCDAMQGFIAQCAALPPVRIKGAPK